MSENVTSTCVEPARLHVEDAPLDCCAIIVAGGLGERFGDPRGKQFVDLCGLPMVCWSLAAFERAASVAHIVVVCPADKVEVMRDEAIGALSLTKPVTLALAGSERQESVRSGLQAAPANLSLVAIHDAARPLIECTLIDSVCAYVRSRPELDGAICAAPVTDTLKLVEHDRITSTVDRSFFWAAQTPQVFRRIPIIAAHEKAYHEGFLATDDAALIEREGGRVDVFESSRNNIKVTMPEDLASAEAILRERLLN